MVHLDIAGSAWFSGAKKAPQEDLSLCLLNISADKNNESGAKIPFKVNNFKTASD